MGAEVPAVTGKFYVGGGAFFLIAVAVLFGAGEFLLLVIIAAGAHELGHYMALKIQGCRVSGVRLGTTGVTLMYERSATYAQEILTTAAGPVASAALALLMALTARLTRFEPAYRLAGMSLLFCVFNLLPVFPLDGGRILHAAIARAFGLDVADRVTCISSCAVIFAALCAGAYILTLTRTNFTLLATAGWLLICYCKNGGDGIKF